MLNSTPRSKIFVGANCHRGYRHQAAGSVVTPCRIPPFSIGQFGGKVIG